MRITWSIPVPGERPDSGRGDLVRARALIDALRAEGHDVRIIADGVHPTARAEVAAYRALVRRLLPQRPALALRDMRRVVRARGHARRVIAAAADQRADVLIETQVHFTGSGALAARVLGRPLVLDDCSPWAEVETLGAGMPGLARQIFRRQTQVAELIVVSSDRLRDRLEADGVPAGKLRVVPNGVRPSPGGERVDRAAVRARLGLGDRVVAAFVGSFQPWHRVDLLVQAIARLDRRPGVHLLLIGDGAGRTAVLDALERHGLERHTTAVGAVAPEIVPELLAASDLGVLPGTNDYGQPMKLVEYAAAGLAAVAPDLPPVRDVVEHGTTGLLFPPGDVHALARAVGRLASDPELRARLGTTARARYATGHGWRDRARTLAAEIAAVRGHAISEEVAS